jgi:hypothetical protein
MSNSHWHVPLALQTFHTDVWRGYLSVSVKLWATSLGRYLQTSFEEISGRISEILILPDFSRASRLVHLEQLVVAVHIKAVTGRFSFASAEASRYPIQISRLSSRSLLVQKRNAPKHRGLRESQQSANSQFGSDQEPCIA